MWNVPVSEKEIIIIPVLQMRNLRILEFNLLKNALYKVESGFKQRLSDPEVEALNY